MKLIVFGATGSVGIQLVQQALEKGHSVTAFTRSPEKIGVATPGLTVCKGDILNAKDVENAVAHHDAVLCAIGDGRKGTVRAAGTQNIVRAMHKNQVRRLVCQTTLGLGDSYGNLNFFWRRVMFGWFLKKAFQDHQLQEKYVIESGLNYTVVRPGAFSNGPVTHNYKTGFGGDYKELTLKISRADVADFMLQQLYSDEYVSKAVSISN